LQKVLGGGYFFLTHTVDIIICLQGRDLEFQK